MTITLQEAVQARLKLWDGLIEGIDDPLEDEASLVLEEDMAVVEALFREYIQENYYLILTDEVAVICSRHRIDGGWYWEVKLYPDIDNRRGDYVLCNYLMQLLGCPGEERIKFSYRRSALPIVNFIAFHHGRSQHYADFLEAMIFAACGRSAPDKLLGRRNR